MRAAAPPAGNEADLLAAFLRGAGMPDARPDDPARRMEQLGAALRALVSGIRRALIARAAVKSEFRIDQTMIRARGNNPLKFSADDDDALAALIGTGRRTDMKPEEAVADALTDIRLHELATMAAMQSAVRALVARLAPEPLRVAAEQGGGIPLPGARKGRAWDAFEALHADGVARVVGRFRFRVRQGLCPRLRKGAGGDRRARSGPMRATCSHPRRWLLALVLASPMALAGCGIVATAARRAGPRGAGQRGAEPEPVGHGGTGRRASLPARFHGEVRAGRRVRAGRARGGDLGPGRARLRGVRAVPSEKQSIKRELKKGTQFLGVVVLFRDIDHAKWRATAPVAASGPSKLALAVGRLSVDLGPAK